PALRHASLKVLAARSAGRGVADEAIRSTPPTPHTTRPTGPAAAFAALLAGEVPSNGMLTYSQRLALLRHAQRLGVGRFEANLLIAAMLERRRQAVGVRADVVDGSTRSISLVSNVAMFLLVQGAF